MLPTEIADDEPIEISPLSARENKRRSELEAVIEENFKGFVKVGLALKEIRESKLYRSTHGLWSSYCSDLWEMNKRHADRLIAASNVIEILGPIGPILPKNEAQARPLTLISDPEDQKQLWQEIVSQAPEGRITASLVERAVRNALGQEREERKGEVKRRLAREEAMAPDVKKFFADLMMLIDEAKHEKWKQTSKEALVKYLDKIKEIVLREA